MGGVRRAIGVRIQFVRSDVFVVNKVIEYLGQAVNQIVANEVTEFLG
jgi:ribosomal protein L14